MNAEIIAVGTEILLGDIANTHAQYLSKELAALGINLHYHSAVGDNSERLAQLLDEALRRSDLILLTGGLGPTNDDLTKEIACEVMGVELAFDPKALEQIRAYFRKTGREMPENNVKQAMLPVGSTVFYNDHGTAPGAAIEKDGKCVVLMPGPPRELIPMFEEQIRPFLMKFSDGRIVSHTLMVTGIGESTIAERLRDLLERQNPTAALYAKDGEVQVRVTAKAAGADEAEEMAAPVVNEIERRLGDYVYGVDVPNLHSVVVGLLREQRLMIATAESCTGGLLSQKLTEVSGASGVFEFGVASYSNRIKEKALGIPAEILTRCGAVSSEVATLMAVGAQREGNADIGVGITGIAGPDGGTEETPVGRVYVAVSYKHKYWVEKLTIGHGNGREREYIRNIATLHALNMVRLVLEGSPRAVTALADLPDFVPAAKPQEDSAAAVYAAPGGWAAAEVDPAFESNPNTGAAALVYGDFESDFEDEDGEEEVRLPWYKRLVRYLIPWKGDPPQEIIRKVIFLIALITLIGSSIYIIGFFGSQVQSDLVHKETLTLYEREPTQEEISNLPEGYLEKFAALYAKNPEIKGWIKINNTRVNFPVMQTTDNSFYLNHNFDKGYNRYGEPFVDYRCTIGPSDQLSTNTIIYGHNSTLGKLFSDVKKYKDINFYKTTPVINFDTVYEETEWKVIAAFVTSGSDDGGYYFQYHNFIEAQSEEHFDWFIRQIKRRSLYNTTVDVEYGDKLLTLSTCTDHSELEDGRVVVVARRVRDGESAAVDTAGATKNPNPLYPDSWYERHGGTKPDYPYDPDPTGNDYPPTGVPGGNSSAAGTTTSQSTSSVRPDDPDIPNPGPSSRPPASSAASSGSNSGASSSPPPPVSSAPSEPVEPPASSQETPPPESSQPEPPPESSEPETPPESSVPSEPVEPPPESSQPDVPAESSEPSGQEDEPTPPGPEE